MEMPAYVNIPDALKIGAIAFAFIWLANRGLEKMGMGQFKTSVS